MGNTIKVNLELNLDDYIRGHAVMDETGEYHEVAPRTLEDVVIDLVAQNIADKLVTQTTYYGELRRKVADAQADLIREKSKELIEQALAIATKDGEYSLEDQIESKMLAELQVVKSGGGYGAPRTTKLTEILEEVSGRVLQARLREALNKGKQQIEEALTQEAAKVVAESIKRTATTL